MGIRHKRFVPALAAGIVVLALLVPAFAVSGGFDAKGGMYHGWVG